MQAFTYVVLGFLAQTQAPRLEIAVGGAAVGLRDEGVGCRIEAESSDTGDRAADGPGPPHTDHDLPARGLIRDDDRRVAGAHGVQYTAGAGRSQKLDLGAGRSLKGRPHAGLAGQGAAESGVGVFVAGVAGDAGVRRLPAGLAGAAVRGAALVLRTLVGRALRSHLAGLAVGELAGVDDGRGHAGVAGATGTRSTLAIAGAERAELLERPTGRRPGHAIAGSELVIAHAAKHVARAGVDIAKRGRLVRGGPDVGIHALTTLAPDERAVDRGGRGAGTAAADEGRQHGSNGHILPKCTHLLPVHGHSFCFWQFRPERCSSNQRLPTFDFYERGLYQFCKQNYNTNKDPLPFWLNKLF